MFRVCKVTRVICSQNHELVEMFVARTSILLPKHTRSLKLFCAIEPSALAAALLVILSIVMTVKSGSHHGLSVDLPRASHAILMVGAEREDAMIVFVMRDGSTYFGNERIIISELPAKIKDRLRDNAVERKVYIRADRRAQYRSIKELLDGLHSSGITKIAFLTTPQRFSNVTP
jgi:biopolymer transport protein ExbD